MYQQNVPIRGPFSDFWGKIVNLFEGGNRRDGLPQGGYHWQYVIADQTLKRSGNILNRFGLSKVSAKTPRTQNAPCQMTLSLDKIRELLSIQADSGGGYNRNAAREVLTQVESSYGQQVVDDLIREFDLESTFDFKPGNSFLSEKG
uniref:Uncharacterized protein n=1 Tax=Candidatus Kentrum sp. TUN TaxID=2126343 RepID=A0A450ZN60_9GAMM|nr:MAG: hypothetical protein BECKTUN1418F_GA0071002_10538 [Candidatus Kentron sp. TUN]VFK55224.1 MAG: hypothetical protein BECKTUN1418D_GA0071000_10295 [Candidatus Kentron sp. TUN]VFK58676.1 MAG: hypothetical protein BECKTUN1418E_GA0071001_10508 [Candidatus Kentron sp. TUN]